MSTLVDKESVGFDGVIEIERTQNRERLMYVKLDGVLFAIASV